jgi:hypothetical protein
MTDAGKAVRFLLDSSLRILITSYLGCSMGSTKASRSCWRSFARRRWCYHRCSSRCCLAGLVGFRIYFWWCCRRLVNLKTLQLELHPDPLFVGSVAAAAQATIPNVIAGSFFAVCQSAAAAGAGLGVVTTATQATGAVVAGAGGVLAWFKG